MPFRRVLVIGLSALAAIPSGIAGGVCLYLLIRLFGGAPVGPGGYVEASPIVPVVAVGVMVFIRVQRFLSGVLLDNRKDEADQFTPSHADKRANEVS